MDQAINVGLIGFGNIGTGVVNSLNQNSRIIETRLGRPLRITRIADTDTKRQRDAQYDPAILTKNADELINDPAIQIVIELVGGLEPARTFVEKALQKGKFVVTANKAMLAVYGPELYRLAEENGVSLLFEASVGGGIPIIRTLQLGLSANRIRRIYGILNGTCNYILTHMAQEHRDFEVVLAEAQAHGFAEPDPTYDVEGYDTAHKIALLASLSFQQDIRFADVFVEGITRLKQIDIEYARELGYTIKLLGIAKLEEENDRVEVRVHPTLLPKDVLLASVQGVFNAIMVEGDLVGQTMFYGRGAGASPTASAVLSDLMSIASSLAGKTQINEHRLSIPVGVKNLKPIAELETSFYLRMMVPDRPGVLAKLSGALGDRNISINSMIQKPHKPSGMAEVTIVTHKSVEGNVQSAIGDIAKMDLTTEPPFVLRVEEDL